MSSHLFEPAQFHNLMGGHQHVLSIKSGDTVVTKTVDAHGFNANNEQVAEKPNPLTGPFFIEEAEEGDCLAVLLDSIVPNRPLCWSHSQLSPGVLDPEAARLVPEQGYAQWEINAEKTHLKPLGPLPAAVDLNLPLSPMLGCIGTAPAAGQVLSTATSGPHGGNMDYAGIAEGATLYFPVFERGALLYLGDGHAAQGDGEIAGSGTEVSLDVRFTVRVLKNRRIRWPRGENDIYLFTLGNARPLDQALQHATTEMLFWLRDEYSIDMATIGLLMGQAAKYDLGNAFDPAYTMACKIPKRCLRG